jgi:hypothetical protein
VQVTAYLTGYCNLAYSALACFRTGMSASFQRDQVLGKNTHDLIHHHRQDGTPFPIEECRVHRLTNGEGVHAEDEVFWRANGTSFPAEYWAYPQRRGEEVGKRLTNTPVRQAGSVLKCPDDRKNRIASAQATYTSGSPAVGG